MALDKELDLSRIRLYGQTDSCLGVYIAPLPTSTFPVFRLYDLRPQERTCFPQEITIHCGESHRLYPSRSFLTYVMLGIFSPLRLLIVRSFSLNKSKGFVFETDLKR